MKCKSVLLLSIVLLLVSFESSNAQIKLDFTNNDNAGTTVTPTPKTTPLPTETPDPQEFPVIIKWGENTLEISSIVLLNEQAIMFAELSNATNDPICLGRDEILLNQFKSIGVNKETLRENKEYSSAGWLLPLCNMNGSNKKVIFAFPKTSSTKHRITVAHEGTYTHTTLDNFAINDATTTPTPSLRNTKATTNTPTATPSPTGNTSFSGASGIMQFNAQLRSEPDSDSEIVSSVSEGDQVIVIGQDSRGSWFLLNDGHWVASDMVGYLGMEIPVVRLDDEFETEMEPTSPSIVPKPTKTPTVVATINQRSNTNISTKSGHPGLGSLKESWDMRYTVTKDFGTMIAYDNFNYYVHFIDEVAYQIDIQFQQIIAKASLAHLRLIALSEFAPDDSIQVDTYTFDTISIVEVYKSKALAEFWEDKWKWGEDPPGTFIVIYTSYDGGLSYEDVIVALGNTP